jgi:hypothetical protein
MKKGSKCCAVTACRADLECPSGRVCCRIPNGQLCADTTRCAKADRVQAAAPPRPLGVQHQCSLAQWDGVVRGWAKLGSAQCGEPGAETGYYLRVAFNQDEAASQAAVAQAWNAYVTTQISGGACPVAKEMMFFDATSETGAGILFPQQPPGWGVVMREEPQWRLLDASNQPVTTKVCFFPAPESRRPVGWTR